MSNVPEKPNAATPTAPHAAGVHPDDLIVVPKGGNKTRFLMTFLLVILLLTTFTVGDEVVRALTGQSRGTKAFMSWQNPSEGRKEVSEAQFLTEKQQLNKFWALATNRQGGDRDDEQTAYFIMLSDLANAAGVRSTDSEIAEFVKSRFQTGPNYKAELDRYRMSMRDFEETLRRYMRMERFQNLLASSLAVADPAEVEKLWKERHQEYAFDYVALPADVMLEEARAIAPPTAELQAWFEALPEADKETYKTAPAVSGEIALFPLAGERPADLLLAKYPLPADVTPEKVARDYYDGFNYVRFKNPDFKLTGQALRAEDFFLPFEQVEAAAKREGPIYRALTAWLADLTGRVERGETVDLAAEAAALGLEHHDERELRTAEQWAEVATANPAIGTYVTESMLSTGVAGQFLPAVGVDEKGLAIARVHAKQEAQLPPFAEIEAQVRDRWIEKKAAELALGRLAKLRTTLVTPPAGEPAAPAAAKVERDAFLEAAAAAGLTVEHHDFAERNATTTDPTPFETFVRQQPALYGLEAGAVAEPAAGGSTAYLVRVDGVRAADPSKMTPADVQNLSRQLAQTSMNEFREKTFQSPEVLKARYGLELESWKTKQERPN